MKKAISALGLVASVSAFGVSASPAALDEGKIKELVSKAAQVDASRIHLSETPSKYLHQIRIDSNVFYVTSDGRLILVGNLHDMKTQENLTEKAQAEIAKEHLANLSDKDLVIYEPAGEAKAEMIVFSDITCPYCEKLHQEIPKYQEAGIRVKIALYPRAGEGSGSFYQSATALCSAEPTVTLNEFMSQPEKKAKINDQKCEQSVRNVLEIGEKVGLQGTPLMFTSKGQKIEGYVPSGQLIPAILSK